jgi:hypothetical protein
LFGNKFPATVGVVLTPTTRRRIHQFDFGTICILFSSLFYHKSFFLIYLGTVGVNKSKWNLNFGIADHNSVSTMGLFPWGIAARV